MAEPGEEIQTHLRRTGWRQGSRVTHPPAIAHLLKVSSDRIAVRPEDVVALIVVTQDCDILQAPEKEPYLEFVAAGKCREPDPQLCHGRNPRILHVPLEDSPGGVWAEICVHHRFRVLKEELQSPIPRDSRNLDDDSLSVLRRWLARRYTRDAFPDAFESRLRPIEGKLQKLWKTTAAKGVSCIFIRTSGMELPADQCYELDIRLTARSKRKFPPVFGWFVGLSKESVWTWVLFDFVECSQEEGGFSLDRKLISSIMAAWQGVMVLYM